MEYGLGNMGFSMGVRVYGFEVGVFYVVVYGSLVWVLQVGLGLRSWCGSFGGFRVEV